MSKGVPFTTPFPGEANPFPINTLPPPKEGNHWYPHSLNELAKGHWQFFGTVQAKVIGGMCVGFFIQCFGRSIGRWPMVPFGQGEKYWRGHWIATGLGGYAGYEWWKYLRRFDNDNALTCELLRRQRIKSYEQLEKEALESVASHGH